MLKYLTYLQKLINYKVTFKGSRVYDMVTCSNSVYYIWILNWLKMYDQKLLL